MKARNKEAKNNQWKIALLGAALVASTITSLILAPQGVGASSLDCEDIIPCASPATCGTSGSVTDCVLHCNDGVTVSCPKDFQIQ